MAQAIFTDKEYRAAKQPIQQKYMRIELLNTYYQVLETLEGVGLNGSISVDANSDIRRTATLKFVITDSTFEVGPDSRIWLDKYIRLYLGTYLMADDEIVYTNIGTFIIDAPSYEYDAVNNSIQLSLLDLMSKLTGVRNGYLPGVPVMVEAGENIREAIIDTLELGGFTKYVVADTGEVPMDLSFLQGSTIYTVLAGLRDIYPNYEIYFDINGIFHYDKIPTGANEAIWLDDDLWDNLVISEKQDVDFQNVKNSIEVWGRTHDTTYVGEITMSGSTIIWPKWRTDTYSAGGVSYTVGQLTYQLATGEWNKSNGDMYNFIIPANSRYKADRIYLAFDGSTSGFTGLILLDSDGSEVTNLASGDSEEYLCACINMDAQATYNNSFTYMGHLQAFGFAEDTNPLSPFYVGGSVGRMRLPLYGGDYDNCLTDDLAYQRAKYELYQHTRLLDTISLSCIPFSFLDVNILVGYTSKRNPDAGQKQYMVKGFSYGFSNTDTMSITLSRYYPEYVEEETVAVLVEFAGDRKTATLTAYIPSNYLSQRFAVTYNGSTEYIYGTFKSNGSVSGGGLWTGTLDMYNFNYGLGTYTITIEGLDNNNAWQTIPQNTPTTFEY